MENNSQIYAEQWKGAAKTIWTTALIMGLGQIAITIFQIVATEAPELFVGYYVPMTIYSIFAVLSIVMFVAQWIQVSNIDKWLKLMNKEQNSTYTHLRRYKVGVQTTLVSSVIFIPLYLLSGPILMECSDDIAFIVTATISIAYIISVVIAGILALMGGVGMAFSTSADSNMSSGMKYIVTSWLINLLLAIIMVLIGMSENMRLIETMTTIMPFISLIIPIIQIGGWNNIRKAQYQE